MTTVHTYREHHNHERTDWASEAANELSAATAVISRWVIDRYSRSKDNSPTIATSLPVPGCRHKYWLWVVEASLNGTLECLERSRAGRLLWIYCVQTSGAVSVFAPSLVGIALELQWQCGRLAIRSYRIASELQGPTRQKVRWSVPRSCNQSASYRVKWFQKMDWRDMSC